MLAPLSPFEAYRNDLGRAHKGDDFGSADTVWLLLAHCLGRLTNVGENVREEIAKQSSDALKDLLGPESGDVDETRHTMDLKLVIAGLRVIATEEGANAVSRACRGFAARMAEAGALSVAYGVLGNARLSLTQTTDRERGLLTADQARVARQLGDLESADELYRTAALVADRSSDSELKSRALLGRGVVARVRGNYPKARMFFLSGLDKAVAANSRELEYFAHQGLTGVGGVMGDIDLGLEHGWAAFRLCDGDAVRESETLTNLAQLCLDAGYAAAALSTFMSAVSRTTVLRVNLSALGGAALAAGRAGDLTKLRKITIALADLVQRSSLPYENAQALRYLASAHLATGDQVTAERFRQEALRIANAKGFHEVALSVERMEIARVSKTPNPRELQSGSQEVVSTLEEFEPDAELTVLATTHWD